MPLVHFPLPLASGSGGASSSTGWGRKRTIASAGGLAGRRRMAHRFQISLPMGTTSEALPSERRDLRPLRHEPRSLRLVCRSSPYQRRLIPNSHRHDTDGTVLSCLVWRCELSRPDRHTGAFCVGSASECVGRSHRQCLRDRCRRDAG